MPVRSRHTRCRRRPVGVRRSHPRSREVRAALLGMGCSPRRAVCGGPASAAGATWSRGLAICPAQSAGPLPSQLPGETGRPRPRTGGLRQSSTPDSRTVRSRPWYTRGQQPKSGAGPRAAGSRDRCRRGSTRRPLGPEPNRCKRAAVSQDCLSDDMISPWQTTGRLGSLSWRASSSDPSFRPVPSHQTDRTLS